MSKGLGVLPIAPDLIRKQQADGFQALLPSVDVVPQKQVVCLWREAAILKQAKEVRVLAVDVAYAKAGGFQKRHTASTHENQYGLGSPQRFFQPTANFDWRLQFQQVGLPHEDLLGRHAQRLYLILGQLHLLARTAVTNFQQPIDYVVKEGLFLLDCRQTRQQARDKRANTLSEMLAKFRLT
jgi:hypothetical protein